MEQVEGQIRQVSHAVIAGAFDQHVCDARCDIGTFNCSLTSVC